MSRKLIRIFKITTKNSKTAKANSSKKSATKFQNSKVNLTLSLLKSKKW